MTPLTGSPADFFDASVAMNGDGLIIGGAQANGAVGDSGQVYLYVDEGTVGLHEPGRKQRARGQHPTLAMAVLTLKGDH